MKGQHARINAVSAKTAHSHGKHAGAYRSPFNASSVASSGFLIALMLLVPAALNHYLVTTAPEATYEPVIAAAPAVSAAISEVADPAEKLAQATKDLDGAPFEDLEHLVKDGSPVLVWVPVGEEVDSCVVLYGVENEKALVNDPIRGNKVYDKSAFASLYNRGGSKACIIQKSDNPSAVA